MMPAGSGPPRRRSMWLFPAGSIQLSAWLFVLGTVLAGGPFVAETEPTAAEGLSQTGARDSERMGDRLFHKPGLIYLWALNDACSDATIDSMIDAFAKANVSAVCLHPRPGLLKPYGGDAWFDFITRTVDRCADKGLDVWL